jgi:outer membrane protein assembly factor BamB
VPGVDGLVYALDAATGRPAADTFVAGYDRSRPTVWRSPSVIGDDALALADTAGRLLILDRKTEGNRSRLVPRGPGVNLGQAIIAGPARAGSTLLVVTADRQIRGFASRDLSPSGAWPLEASLAGDLVERPGGWVLATDTTGLIQAFGSDGQKRWSRRLSSPPLPGAPAVQAENQVAFTTRAGRLEVLRLADGEPVGGFDLGQPPVGPALAVDGGWAVPWASGSIRMAREGEGSP